MAAQGLEVVVEERIQTRPSLLAQMNELHLLSLMDVRPGLSENVDRFKEGYFDRLVEESGEGVACLDRFIVVVGRKGKNFDFDFDFC